MATESQSKTELLQRREERLLVREGKDVLEERRDLLAHYMLDTIRRTESLADELRAEIEAARQWTRAAVLRHGLRGLGAFSSQQSALSQPQWRSQNVLGVAWIEAQRDIALTTRPPYAGDSWDGSLELDEATDALRRLLLTSARISVAENNLARLTAAFVRTDRKVRALENVVLPEMDEEIRSLEVALEESEREAFGRVLFLKRRSQVAENR